MDIPTYSTVVLKLTNQIDALTKSFIFNGYNTLSNYLAQPLALLCVIYIVLRGYGMVKGLIKTPIQEFTKGAIRMGIVYMFAMNWGVFSDYLVKLFINSASELGGVLMQATPFDVPVITGSGVNGGLQSVLIEVIRVGSWTWAKASFNHFGPIFTAIMIYLSGLAVVGLALFEFIIAKLMLSICLCTTPLFLCFTLFEKTRTFFDRWLGTMVGFSLVLILVSSVVGLCMHLIHWAIGGHYLNHAANITAVDWMPIFIVACLCVMAILEVTGIAKSIGGTCSTSNGSAMVGGFIGGALGASRTGQTMGGKALDVAKTILPESTVENLRAFSGKSQVQSESITPSFTNHPRGRS
ncbi:type IV secretion system protein [Legionella longbeachae]|uniref:type IV secretion system protein n=1 Tax=Legionella longbeachae TaxID=450 RepID=UPI0001BEBC93|nr:type IV secretion system protein [Legionella longbeachae]EEZ95949.1 Legionella vir-like protein LvhB6 [Legionella longbeachae D-4968]